MTDITQEINFMPRTLRFRPERIVLPADWKVSKRCALARRIMAEFCERRGISEDDLRARSQELQAVARRRKYAQICRAAGIGRCIIAYALHMDGSTVAAYLDPGIVEKKVLRARARRMAQKTNCSATADVAQELV